MVDLGGDFSFFKGIHVKIDIRRIDISNFIRPMINKFGKQVHLQDLTHYIRTSRVPVATKLGRVTYLDGFLPIKSHDPLILCYCKITCQTKIFMSPLPQCLWPPNLAG